MNRHVWAVWAGLVLWGFVAAPAWAVSDVPSACFTFDVGGGGGTNPRNPIFTVRFDPMCTLPAGLFPVPNPNGLAYRAIWEFNTTGQGVTRNPNVVVAGATVIPNLANPTQTS